MKRHALIVIGLFVAAGIAHADCADPARAIHPESRSALEQALGAEEVDWSLPSTVFAVSAVMERLLEEGHYLDAVELGKIAEDCAVHSDPLLDFLYGDALLRKAQNLSARAGAKVQARQLLDQAEIRLMRSMRAEPNSRTAELIGEIRLARDSMTTRTFQQVVAVVLNKIGDLIVLIIAFFSGALLAGGLGPLIRYGRLQRAAKKDLARAMEKKALQRAVECVSQLAENEESAIKYDEDFMAFSDKLEKLLADDRIAYAREVLEDLVTKLGEVLAENFKAGKAQATYDQMDVAQQTARAYKCAKHLLGYYVDSPERLRMLEHMLDGMQKRTPVEPNN